MKNTALKPTLIAVLGSFFAFFTPTLADNNAANVGVNSLHNTLHNTSNTLSDKTSTASAIPTFISLTLCSDRLLMALARPEQIIALSPYSTDPHAMLNVVNTDKPTLSPRLSELLPYADATILLNEQFYPRLVKRLRQLGFQIFPINDSPQTVEALFSHIHRIAKLTGNPDKAHTLIHHIKTAQQQLQIHQQRPPLSAVSLTENGVAQTTLPQFHTLYQLLNLTESFATAPQNFLEKLITHQPDVILQFSYDNSYSEGRQRLFHPVIKRYAQDKIVLSTAVKYTYCFDHGVWQGAMQLHQQQLKSQPNTQP